MTPTNSTHAPPGTFPAQRVSELLGQFWWIVLLRGIVLCVLGLYALLQPGMTLGALTILLGIYVLIDGILAIVAGIMNWTSSRGWTIARGVLGVVVALVVLAHPFVVGTIAAVTLLFFFVAQLIAGGILEIVAAVRDRKEIDGAGWLFVGGVLSILFGLLLAAAPLLSAVALIRVVGIYALIFGVALIANSLQLRKLGKRLDSSGGE